MTSKDEMSKGKWGGPRKNAGGARPGAGRKPKKAPAPAAKKSTNKRASAAKVGLEAQPHGGALKRAKADPVPQTEMDMLELLKQVALGKTVATDLQVRAAIAAVQYTHPKVGEGGKKAAKDDAAKRAAAGKFASVEPPPRARVN